MATLLVGLGKILPSRLQQDGDLGLQLGRQLGVAAFVLNAMLVIWAAMALARAAV
jgi:hypothetical protein